MSLEGFTNVASRITFPSVKFVRTRKMQHAFISWPLVTLSIIFMIAATQAQTFQYSRGWTNGKRSGPAGPATSGGFIDLDNYVNPEVADFGILPGHFQMTPQGRLRTLDYNQYFRKFGVGSSGNLNTRKQPLWFGTIMGMDSSDTAPATSQQSNSNSNPSPSGASSDF